MISENATDQIAAEPALTVERLAIFEWTAPQSHTVQSATRKATDSTRTPVTSQLKNAENNSNKFDFREAVFNNFSISCIGFIQGVYTGTPIYSLGFILIYPRITTNNYNSGSKYTLFI